MFRHASCYHAFPSCVFSVYFAPCNYDDTGHTDILSRRAHAYAEAFSVFHLVKGHCLHLNSNLEIRCSFAIWCLRSSSLEMVGVYLQELQFRSFSTLTPLCFCSVCLLRPISSRKSFKHVVQIHSVSSSASLSSVVWLPPANVSSKVRSRVLPNDNGSPGIACASI